MTKNYQRAVTALESLIADDSHLKGNDLREELSEMGVDADAFLIRLRRSLAPSDKAEPQRNEWNLTKEGGPLHNLNSRSAIELRDLLSNIRRGIFGQELRAAALSMSPDDPAGDVSEAQLRAWLQDISKADE